MKRRRIARSYRMLAPRVRNAVFGDRVGTTVFLGALVFFALTWRVGFLLNDNYTLANTLVNLADGQLAVERIVFGPEPGATPRMKYHDGTRYGSSYAQAVLALPFLRALEALAMVTDLPVALSAGFSALLLAFVRRVGVLADREQTGTLAGSALALAVFGGNVAFATPLADRWLPLLALQLTTVLVAALVPVVSYRLVARRYGTREGVFVACVLALASPVAFWATIPKRHNLVALLAMLVLYSLHRGRAEDSLAFRALAYAWVGLTAWVFSIDGFLLFVALVVADVGTGGSLRRRDVAAVGGAFAIALVPFLVTNYLLSGVPLRPPLLLPSYADVLTSVEGGGTHPSPPAGPSAPSGNPVLSTVVGVGWRLLHVPIRSVRAATDPTRLYHVFVRSGYVESVAEGDKLRVVRLAVVESMPLLGGLAALPVVLRTRLATRATWSREQVDPADAFAVVGTLAFVAFYLPYLPIHASMTVRYLHPVYALGAYGLVRLAPVRNVLDRAPGLLAGTYAAVVLVGGQLFVLALWWLAPSLSEAVQLSALTSLAAAGLLAGWALLAATGRAGGRSGAIVLGAAGGSTTVFLLLGAFEYFTYATRFALPLSRVVAEIVALL